MSERIYFSPYVKYINDIISLVLRTQIDLLHETEKNLLQYFLDLDESSQSLLTRMSLRKGHWLRTNSFVNYIPQSLIIGDESEYVVSIINGLIKKNMIIQFNEKMLKSDINSVLLNCLSLEELKHINKIISRNTSYSDRNALISNIISSSNTSRSIFGQPLNLARIILENITHIASINSTTSKNNKLSNTGTIIPKIIRVEVNLLNLLRRVQRLVQVSSGMSHSSSAYRGMSIRTPLAFNAAMLVTMNKIRFPKYLVSENVRFFPTLRRFLQWEAVIELRAAIDEIEYLNYKYDYSKNENPNRVNISLNSIQADIINHILLIIKAFDPEDTTIENSHPSSNNNDNNSYFRPSDFLQKIILAHHENNQYNSKNNTNNNNNNMTQPEPNNFIDIASFPLSVLLLFGAVGCFLSYQREVHSLELTSTDSSPLCHSGDVFDSDILSQIDPGTQLAKLCSLCVTSLEELKNDSGYQLSVLLLRFLLSLPYSPHRRRKWRERLCINLYHLGEVTEALEEAVRGKNEALALGQIDQVQVINRRIALLTARCSRQSNFNANANNSSKNNSKLFNTKSTSELLLSYLLTISTSCSTSTDTKLNEIKSESTKNSLSTSSKIDSIDQDDIVELWECTRCTLLNEVNVLICAVCELQRVVRKKPTDYFHSEKVYSNNNNYASNKISEKSSLVTSTSVVTKKGKVAKKSSQGKKKERKERHSSDDFTETEKNSNSTKNTNVIIKNEKHISMDIAIKQELESITIDDRNSIVMKEDTTTTTNDSDSITALPTSAWTLLQLPLNTMTVTPTLPPPPVRSITTTSTTDTSNDTFIFSPTDIPSQWTPPLLTVSGRRLGIGNRGKSRFVGLNDDTVTVEQFVMQLMLSGDLIEDEDEDRDNGEEIDNTNKSPTIHHTSISHHNTTALNNDNVSSNTDNDINHLKLLWKEGGWQGWHCEGSYLQSLFGLLMWDELFMTVTTVGKVSSPSKAPRESDTSTLDSSLAMTIEANGSHSNSDIENNCSKYDTCDNSSVDYLPVFITPYQDAPLDLGQSASFFLRRKEAIEKKLFWMTQAASTDLITFIGNSYRSHYRQRCRGVNWVSHPLHTLQLIAVCIGGRGLSGICRALSADYSYFSGGKPDLLMIRISVIDKKYSNDNNPAITKEISNDDIYIKDDNSINDDMEITPNKMKYHPNNNIDNTLIYNQKNAIELYDIELWLGLEWKQKGKNSQENQLTNRKRKSYRNDDDILRYEDNFTPSKVIDTIINDDNKNINNDNYSMKIDENVADISHDDNMILDELESEITNNNVTDNMSKYIDKFECNEVDLELPTLVDTNKELVFESFLVEVKGPTDSLAPKQLLWLQILCANGINSAVCQIDETSLQKKLSLKSKQKASKFQDSGFRKTRIRL